MDNNLYLFLLVFWHPDSQHAWVDLVDKSVWVVEWCWYHTQNDRVVPSLKISWQLQDTVDVAPVLLVHLSDCTKPVPKRVALVFTQVKGNLLGRCVLYVIHLSTSQLSKQLVQTDQIVKAIGRDSSRGRFGGVAVAVKICRMVGKRAATVEGGNPYFWSILPRHQAI